MNDRRRRSLTPWLACTLFVSAAALSQPPLSAQPAAAPDQSNSARADDVTVIGCLVRLDTSALRPGTSDPIPSGHPGQPVSAGYALKEAIATAAEPERGPVATRSDREFGIAKGDVSVDRFAGHQVVIKGRLISTGGDAVDKALPVPGHDVLIDVTSVRSISDSCPPRG
jgi:hypothetical protein